MAGTYRDPPFGSIVQLLADCGLLYALLKAMKPVFRADGRPSGFITAALVPSNRTQMSRFGKLDAVVALIILILLIGTVVAVRFVLLG
jgi:hypothetical protein